MTLICRRYHPANKQKSWRLNSGLSDLKAQSFIYYMTLTRYLLLVNWWQIFIRHVEQFLFCMNKAYCMLSLCLFLLQVWLVSKCIPHRLPYKCFLDNSFIKLHLFFVLSQYLLLNLNCCTILIIIYHYSFWTLALPTNSQTQTVSSLRRDHCQDMTPYLSELETYQLL